VVRARLTRADRWALGILVVVPVLVNVPWALAGHPVLDGDNLTQNYPLRVLVGQLLAHGRLPLWDPGIWSGVPLLAGWNAGAMFPGTWLFAVLPGVVSFEVNIVLAGIACGVGFHLFLRRQGCSPLAAVLGAVTWSEMGFVSGQQCHLGLIEGTALAPWILLAIDGMFRVAGARRPPVRGGGWLAGSGHWIALLGASAALVVLAGDPRAVSSDAIIAVLYLAARCWRAPSVARRVVTGVGAGAAVAIAMSAVQWLPGLVYLHSSQRSVSTLSLFGSGSLGWSDLPLLVTPYLLGGNGNFGMPSYAGPLNMPEVTYAVGILPLIALFALAPRWLGQLTRRARQGFARLQGHNQPGDSAPASEPSRSGLGVWYAMFVVGAVLSTGTETPLGHLLVHLPLYGGQRLQNRNAAIGDFALAALLAVFVDTFRPAGAGTGARAGAGTGARAGASEPTRAERRAGAIPVAAVLGLVASMFAWTAPVERWLGVTSIQADLPTQMAGYYAAAVVIALGGLVVLWRSSWPSIDGWRRAAATVVAADLLLFVAMASYQPIPLSTLASSNPAASTLKTHLAPGARTAIDDPDQLALDFPPFLVDELGVNDLVLLHALASVQGYGSAVPAAYEAATGSHDVENLLPSALLGPLYDELDLGVVAVVPEQFGTILPSGTAPRIPPGPPLAVGTSAADRQPGDVARATYPPAGPWRLVAAGVRWELPAPTRISAVTVLFDPQEGPSPTGAVVVTVTLANGRTVRVSGAPEGERASLPLPSSQIAAGRGALAVSVTDPGASATSEPVVGAVAVTADAASAPLALHQRSSGTVTYVLNGWLQGLLQPPHWIYVGRIGPLVLYGDTKARGAAWVEAPRARVASAPAASGSVTTLTVAYWQDPVDVVDSPAPVLLVRSEQYSPGWTATIQRVGAGGSLGPAHTRTVVPVGLLQGVELPAGHYEVTWHYRSARADVGLGAGVLGTLACAVLAVVGLRRRRRRSSPPRRRLAPEMPPVAGR
jgi:hypothetical protein